MKLDALKHHPELDQEVCIGRVTQYYQVPPQREVKVSYSLHSDRINIIASTQIAAIFSHAIFWSTDIAYLLYDVK